LSRRRLPYRRRKCGMRITRLCGRRLVLRVPVLCWGSPVVAGKLGLYYTALGQRQNAIDAFHKVLFIAPDDIAATVHLCRVYLEPRDTGGWGGDRRAGEVEMSNVDLAAGLLAQLTRGPGWDSAEAWYFLAKACALQGRKERERECLSFALVLSERRGLRDVGVAIGHCL
jgi:tetratricopeptide (TPR) repeat protein